MVPFSIFAEWTLIPAFPCSVSTGTRWRPSASFGRGLSLDAGTVCCCCPPLCGWAKASAGRTAKDARKGRQQRCRNVDPFFGMRMAISRGCTEGGQSSKVEFSDCPPSTVSRQDAGVLRRAFPAVFVFDRSSRVVLLRRAFAQAQGAL